MKPRVQLLIVLLLAPCGWHVGVASACARPEIFGTFPVCEPSAVVQITCPEADMPCLLVGDNEHDAAVFLYPVNAASVASATQTALSLVVESPEITAQRLFDAADLVSNANLAAVGDAIDAAEAQARQAEGNESACQQVQTFNAEGAVAFATETGAPEVWIGLRSPVVRIAAENYAVLLRLANLQTYHFNAAAFLNLGGRGIRDMTLDADSIWGIAGGPADGQENFELWKMPRNALQPNAILTPELVRPLPAASEGLAIVEQTVYVLIDGNRGKGGDSCKESGKYMQFPR